MLNKIDFSRIQRLRLLCVLAAAAMLLPVPIMQFVGEESYYAVSAIEMHITGDYWHHLILGMVWPKTPLYLWLAIGWANILGWEHIDIALRLVSVISTWVAALAVGLLARHLFRSSPNSGWLAALIYLSMGEISFWYGWLGYADANFGMFVFTSISALWLAIERQHIGWFLLSLLLVSMAYLSKNIAAYYFYGVAGLVLLYRMRRWHLLLRPSFIVPGILALLVPWWYQTTFVHAGSNSMVAIRDGLRNFHGYNLLEYIKHWFSYPAIFFFRALPVSFFLFWLLIKRKQVLSVKSENLTVLLVLAACFLPFWISAGGSPRYLVPFYALAAILFTGLLLQLEAGKQTLAIKLMVVVLILKIPYSLVVLPYIKDWRPNRSLLAVTEDILQRTEGETVRTLDDIASGLSIAAYLDVRLPPEKYIRWYSSGEHGVYIMVDLPDVSLGRLVRDYPIRGRHIYLYWKP